MKSNKVITILLAALIAYLLCIRFLLIFSWSTDLDGAEFSFVKHVIWMLHGKPMYGDPCAFPYFSTLYYPGYNYLLYYVSLLFKIDYLKDVHAIFIEARSISFLCMLVNIYLIVKCLRLLGVQAKFYLFLVALYLLLITGHFYVTRPDAIKTTLFTLSIYAILHFIFYNGRWFYFLLFNITVALAMWFKQDAAVDIMLATACLCVLRPEKKTTILFVSAGVNIFLLLAVLNLICGKYFFINTVLFNIQQITDLDQSYNLAIMLISIVRTLPLFLIAVYGCNDAIKRGSKKNIDFFLPAIALVTFVPAHVFMLRAGSFLNYSYEPVFLLILTLGMFFKKYEPRLFAFKNRLVLATVVYMTIIFAGNFVIHSYTYDPEAEQQSKADYFSKWETKTKLDPIIGSDTVFFLNPKFTLFYEDKTLLLGYDIHIARIIEILANCRLHSHLVFVSCPQYDTWFTNGSVKYILAEDDEVSKRQMTEEFKHYRQFEKVDGMLVYRFSN